VHGMNYYGVKEVSVIQSDFTRDGKIDYDDFFLFADSFGASRGQSEFLPMFDLDYDNQIDFDDFFKFADQFGTGAGNNVLQKRGEITQEFLLANVDSNSESCNSLADEGNTRITGTDIGQCEYGAEMCRYSEFGGWAEVMSPIGPEDEICDGVDNDCDGQIDNDCDEDTDSSTDNKFTSGSGKTSKVKKFYYDGDGDRYGLANDYQTYAFGRYRALEAGDCSDNNVNANPNAAEICDNVDNNCDGQTDENNVCGVGVDSDEDGFASFLYGGLDCNDNNSNINPDEEEICDNVDNNCNGQKDEGVTTTYYLDADEDGFGDVDATTEACSAPNGYVEDDNDCSDNNDDVKPGVEEICNLVDDNCNGTVNEGSVCVVPAAPTPAITQPTTQPPAQSEPVSTPSEPSNPVVTVPTGDVVVEEPATEELVVEIPEETAPAEKPAAVKGDFTEDGKVDYDDFFKFADYFGTNNEEYDLDNDGDVDYDDFFLFSDQFGTGVN